MTSYVIKAAITDRDAAAWTFTDAKTMYGGKAAQEGDKVYIFASETSGGAGLLARGVVVTAEPTPRLTGVERQTPRVSLTVQRTGTALRPLGRRELKGFADRDDGRPETELNFKLYRQATDKLVGISHAAAGFLESFFR